MAAQNNEIVHLHICKEQKKLIKYASELSNVESIAEFVVFHATKSASEIIVGRRCVLKSLGDKRVFAEALIFPPAPNKRLKKAQLNCLMFEKSNEDYNNWD